MNLGASNHCQKGEGVGQLPVKFCALEVLSCIICRTREVLIQRTKNTFPETINSTPSKANGHC